MLHHKNMTCYYVHKSNLYFHWLFKMSLAKINIFKEIILLSTDQSIRVKLYVNNAF